MVFSQITTTIGEVNSISIKANYLNDPLDIFSLFSKDKQNSLLLESAEIDSKDNLKSLMLIDTAVKFECNGQIVTVTALVDNGLPVVHHLAGIFKQEYADSTNLQLNDNTLVITFLDNDTNVDEDTRLKQANAFEVLRSAVNSIVAPEDSPFALFLGGVFAYDMLANFESLPDVGEGLNTCPDYLFYLAETMVIVDHQKQQTELIGNVFSGENAFANCFSVGKRLEELKQLLDSAIKNKAIKDAANSNDHKQNFGFSQLAPRSVLNNKAISVNVADDSFQQQVIQLKNNIVQGDVFQVVPSRCFSLPCSDALDAYRHLKQDNPSPYMFYLKADDFTLFGASPESALKYSSTTKQVEVYPIAGTRIRGFRADGSINADLDSRIELDLRNDKKEVAEHLMLVDLARNDVARISEPGTRYVKELLKVDRYSYVMHLVSRVIGTLRNDLDALHAYQACMNMGTLVGAPKIRAATLIRNVEQARRGSYGGAVGYINGSGDMDTCIVIRSAFVKDGLAHVQAGAGVVYDSDPIAECEETQNKAQAVLKAIQASQLHLGSSESPASGLSTKGVN
ncbi:anthranilate synthase component 1 [Psychrosphaera saromensis]|uniref:Anthranilate synthase component 1 n=1 Tax=Psychrosphaera saromensis TaxID=716813 RepID=A0A2S7UW84_9GAMM|nr:anthranilate synthase component 1 [Psychrosphaera saromensis]PQJ54197.1 anthranilate synthase component I [Psychrosphaera saromensis]GHB75143.1 anthranilate synthase component 1 [Psychrosphaera saromensis]GLQ12707.1 anthranilate synthase component 1 [Psychrosphaera saromensis]